MVMFYLFIYLSLIYLNIKHGVMVWGPMVLGVMSDNYNAII